MSGRMFMESVAGSPWCSHFTGRSVSGAADRSLCAGLKRPATMSVRNVPGATRPLAGPDRVGDRNRCAQRTFSAQAWSRTGGQLVGIIWTMIIGFLAGVIAKFLMPGKNEPSGFVLTTILGIVGAFVATFLGQSLGWYGPNEGAGLVGAALGAIVVLAVWGLLARRA